MVKVDGLARLRVVIVVHESLPSVFGENLKKYLFACGILELLYITHPLIYIKEFYKKSSRYDYYENGKLRASKTAFHWVLPDVFLYCKDVIYTIIWCWKTGKRWDIFFAADNLNALSGLILRTLGRVDKVVFHTVDYFPVRFANKLLNWIYHFIDKICVRFADETWNLSPVMIEAREKHHSMDRRAYNRQFIVPIGVWFNEAPKKPFSKIDKNKIVYVGYLDPIMGVELAILAMPRILKSIPKARLEIIGGGNLLPELQALAKKLGVSQSLKFYGWVSDRGKVWKLLSDGAVGLATFNPRLAGEKVKNADPAKIKEYMLFGLPVVVTRAISNYKEISAAQCGIVIDYKAEELAQAVVQLLSDRALLKRCRRNALRYVRQFDYGRIFGAPMNRLLGS